MKNSVAESSPEATSLRGIAYFLVVSVLFITMDVLAKIVATELNAVMAAWGRYSFHLLFVALLFATGRFGRIGATAQPVLQLVRSLLLAAATVSFFTMLVHMPLADSVAISYVGPIFITILAALVLGERVGPRRWVAVVIGFVGAIIIMRPGLGGFHWAASLGLVTALCYASYAVATRMLTGRDSPYTTIFYTALVGAVVLTAAVPFFWEPPSLELWGLMAILGLLGGVSHFFLIKAYEYAQASALAPYGYLDLIWAALFGLFVFGDFPDHWTIVGAAIVVASGLYIFYRERRARRS